MVFKATKGVKNRRDKEGIQADNKSMKDPGSARCEV